jgi:hypothetical protein
MSDQKKHDPFKPQQPAIPGVPEESANEEKRAVPAPPPAASLRPSAASKSPALPSLPEKLKSQMIPIIMGVIALAIFAVMAMIWRSRQSAADDSEPAAAAPAATPAADVPRPAAASSDEPVAPGVIATADELAAPWAAKNFIFRTEATGESTPAMVVHLPRGGYWGFSLIEPYGQCRLEYVTNLQKLAKAYEYPADHPMVGDPCSHTLFDLLRYGGPMNAEVRGAIVHGSALRPPVAIEIQQHGREVLAVKMEE